MRTYLLAFALAAALIGGLGAYALCMGIATHAAACGNSDNCYVQGSGNGSGP